MDWKDCALFLESVDIKSRFDWPSNGVSGFDCEDSLTISDIWGAIAWTWTWPGDWALSQEPLRTFFEIEGQTAAGAGGSTIIGSFCLVGILIIVGLVSALIDAVIRIFH